jgi:hypothetical protein
MGNWYFTKKYRRYANDSITTLLKGFEMTDIKETKEVVVAVADLIKAGLKVVSDGHVSFTDIPVLFGILGTLNDAIKGVKLIPAELKDLDQKEITELGQLLVTIIMGFKK